MQEPGRAPVFAAFGHGSVRQASRKDSPASGSDCRKRRKI